MRTTEELVAEVQHKAQAAVNEVKEAAIDEIRRALGERNNQQTDARINLERAILDLRSRAGSGGGGGLLKLGNFSRKEDEGGEVCWNCGRSATETCSGCNLARYCSPFCQHRDWESPHKICRPAGHAHQPHPPHPTGSAQSESGSSVSGSPADAVDRSTPDRSTS